MTNTDFDSKEIELSTEQKEVLLEAYRLLLSWAREKPTQPICESHLSQDGDTETSKHRETPVLTKINEQEIRVH